MRPVCKCKDAYTNIGKSSSLKWEMDKWRDRQKIYAIILMNMHVWLNPLPLSSWRVKRQKKKKAYHKKKPQLWFISSQLMRNIFLLISISWSISDLLYVSMTSFFIKYIATAENEGSVYFTMYQHLHLFVILNYKIYNLLLIVSSCKGR